MARPARPARGKKSPKWCASASRQAECVPRAVFFLHPQPRRVPRGQKRPAAAAAADSYGKRVSCLPFVSGAAAAAAFFPRLPGLRPAICSSPARACLAHFPVCACVLISLARERVALCVWPRRALCMLGVIVCRASLAGGRMRKTGGIFLAGAFCFLAD